MLNLVKTFKIKDVKSEEKNLDLVNFKKMSQDALKNKCAVGAYNFVNLEVLKAIVEVANECNSPVVVQASTGAIRYMGLDTIVPMLKSLKSKVKVCLNLDHGQTFEDCKNAIDAGFTNVMIDGSHLPYEENVKLTKKVVDYAHKFDVTVEGELGTIGGKEDDVSGQIHYTDPTQALDFVNRTGVDSLAIAIGTSHGPNKFSGEAHLRIDILEQIEKLMPKIPLVLHGASSVPKFLKDYALSTGMAIQKANGVPEDILNECATHNICKINVVSDLRIAYTAGVREVLNSTPECIDIRTYNKNGMTKVKELIAHKMKDVFLTSRS